MHWRNLPERYRKRTAVCNSYVRWGRKDVWMTAFDVLAQEVEGNLTFIDSSIVKATAQRLGQIGGTGGRIQRVLPRQMK